MNNKNDITKEYKLNMYIERDIIEKIKTIALIEKRALSEQIRFFLQEAVKKYKHNENK